MVNILPLGIPPSLIRSRLTAQSGAPTGMGLSEA